MEYLAQRGAFTDVPLAAIVADFRAHYPGWVGVTQTRSALADADFEADVERET